MSERTGAEKSTRYRVYVLLLGLFIGIFGGMFGLGGGIIMVPLLLFLFKKNVYTATATSLAVIGPMALAGSISNAFKGNINYPAFIFMSLGAVGGAYLGAAWAKKVPQEVLRKMLGAAVLLTSLAMIFKISNPGEGSLPSFNLSGSLVLMGLGVVVGIFSGMLGLGGGVLMLPMMIFGFGFSAHMATATSLAIMVPTSASGSIKSFKTGALDMELFILIALGAVFGSVLGTIFAGHINKEHLRTLIGVVVFLISIFIIFKKKEKKSVNGTGATEKTD